MATLVLSTVGAAVGGALGGPFGALLGRALGALAGGVIDARIASALAPAQHVQGPRLKELQVQASTEGAPLPRIYGRVRLAGQIIWATRIREEVHTQTSGGGGKGGGPKVTTTTYHYYANFAVALCEGPVARIERVWADGKPLDVDDITLRFYPGDETQTPDPLIVAVEGTDNAPAYRGVAYVVLENLHLEPFGNRIPQLTFEVVRPVDDVAGKVRAVNIIPGAGEFFCDTQVVRKTDAPGSAGAENAHATERRSDWQVSIDQLQHAAPSLDAAALIVSWFGDDLRCGNCTIRPRVEVRTKRTAPEQWRVAGLSRAGAQVVSLHDGKPAFGGTPSDASVIRAIRDLNARGLKPVFYPFIMMDIPAANTLPDPYTGASSQPAYPWRGRITCDPAPGRPGTPDKTAALNSQINAFIGTAQASDFYLSGDEVIYTGPAEWSYRRFILHYAWLCKAAGNVEAFLIGSELRGLTTLRNGPASYPFVQALKALAADVKSILGSGVKISYAADWSEWFGHHPQDGSGDLFFHLDDLWADANVDFIGIDNYMPLSDWRAGARHLDAQAGAASIYDTDYLKSNIAGGEGFDWYYASEDDRAAQNRTPITDGAYGKPWVWRYKDLKSWWENAHYNRPGGTEDTSPTAWTPRSKPFWFTEAGCPALDKGANQPNVFFDPKSSESALPHFSNGRRDDAMQKAYMRALLEYWGAPGPHNPTGAYGGPMVEPSRIFFWAWDARPYPWYPALADVWGDVANYEYGHWLNGRLDAPSLEAIIRAILRDWGFADSEMKLRGLGGQLAGFAIDRPMSARAALEPLLAAFAVDVTEEEGRLCFTRRALRAAATISTDDLVETGADEPLFEITRADATEVPDSIAFDYLEEAAEQRTATIRLRASDSGALTADSGREPMLKLQLPAAVPQAVAGGLAAMALRQARAAREQLSCAVSRAHLALQPGDVIAFTPPDGAASSARLWRIERIADEEEVRRITAVSHDPLAMEAPPWPPRRYQASQRQPLPAPEVLVLDIPRLRDAHNDQQPYAAAFSRPWPGVVALLRDPGAVLTELDAPAVMGELLDDLPAARPWLYMRGSGVRVRLYSGSLASVAETDLFAGANAAVIGDVAGNEWEVVQFLNARLEAAGVWRLSMLLRGQRGSEPELKVWPAGSRFVLLNAALQQVAGIGAADMGTEVALRAGPASRDTGDPTWKSFSHPFTGRALRPLAPVHLRARKSTGGDVSFSWIRRSRVPEAADAWGVGDAPLAEQQEHYEIAMFDGAAEVRRWQVSTPRATWTAAEQAADFPAGLPATITVHVAQIGETFGPGAWLQKEVRL
jgi:hypothetical protein